VATATVTPSPTAVPAFSGPYRVGKATSFRTPFGAFHIVGEVSNGSSSPVEQVRLRATAYDAGGAVVATQDALACLGVVPPGGESPFEIPFFQATGDIARYAIEVEARPASREAPSGLDAGNILVTSSPSGEYRLSGEIRNNSRTTYRFVQVCAAFYDAAGNVVRVDSTFTNPPTLDPRESGDFEVAQTATAIDTYRIWTTGQP
jgi:hypothetical protein